MNKGPAMKKGMPPMMGPDGKPMKRKLDMGTLSRVVKLLF